MFSSFSSVLFSSSFTIFLAFVSCVIVINFVSAQQVDEFDAHSNTNKNDNNNDNNNWVLFHIDSAGHSTVLGARSVSTPASPCVPFPEEEARDQEESVAASSFHHDHSAHSHDRSPPAKKKLTMRNRMIVVTYIKNAATGEKCHVLVKDPRLLWHDHPHPTHGESHYHGHLQTQENSNFAIVMSSAVEQLETIDLGSKRKDKSRRQHKVGERELRSANTLASAIDPTQLKVKTHQMVGTTTAQRNMVFLGSGYTAAEETKFYNDVQSILTFIQQSSTTVSSMPYFRYFSTFNFFSVFHPSLQSGASHPAPAGNGVAKDNILDCTYGSSSSRILSCNRPRVLVMASYAPPDPSTSITIVLVNDDVFGGTGSPGICSVYTGSRMASVFIHEIGHAFADLSDEYSYDTSESQQLALLNCNWDPVVDIPWRDWINASVLGLPDPVCTYLNYYKPKPPGSCLMESDQFTLCEVCKEATVRTIYGQINDNAPLGINLASPRFPSEHDTIVVRESQNATIWMNARLNTHVDSSGKFSSKWMLDNGTSGLVVLAENVSSLSIVNATGSGAAAEWLHPAGAANYTIILEITDHTSMILPAKRQQNSQNTSSRKSFKQRHRYNIRIIADSDTSVSCTMRNNTHGGQYCGICDAGYESECTLNVTAQPIASIKDVSGAIPELEGWLIGLGCGFVGLGAIAFFFTFKTMQQHAEENVGEILPLSDALVVLRYVLMGFQILLLLASTFVIMYAAYMFIVLSIFGRPMVLGICIVACLTWFFSFVGFSGAYFNNRQVVFASFILAIFFMALTLIFTGMLLHTQANVNTDDDVFLQLRSEWQATVKGDPAAACKMESYLYCSGFESSCYTAIGATSDCPARCEVANQLAFPCWPKVQDFVRHHFYNAAVGGIILTVFLFVIMITSVVFGCGMKINKARITRQRYKRAQEGHNTLSDNELTMLRNEFRKVDKNKTGQITRDQFAKFYSKTMGVAMNKDQLQEYFDALDSDASGTLSFEEFVKIYMPAVDVSTEMLEREKKRDDERAAERNRLLSPRLSPSAANVDPLAAAAEAEAAAVVLPPPRASQQQQQQQQQQLQQQQLQQQQQRRISELSNASSQDGVPQGMNERNISGIALVENSPAEEAVQPQRERTCSFRNVEGDQPQQEQNQEHEEAQARPRSNTSSHDGASDEHIVVVDDHDDQVEGGNDRDDEEDNVDEKLSESARLRNIIRQKASQAEHE